MAIEQERQNMDGQMDGFEIYREMVKAWRKCGWGWDEVAVAHRPVEVLKQKLESWRKDGYPAIAFEEWMGLVEACRAAEEADGKPTDAKADEVSADSEPVAPVAEEVVPDPAVPGASVATDVPPEAEPEALRWSADGDVGSECPDGKGASGEPYVNVQHGNAGAEPEAVPEEADPYFLGCLRLAPVKVRRFLSGLGVRNFPQARAVTPAQADKVQGCGRKAVELLAKWLAEYPANTEQASADAAGTAGAVMCRDHESWSSWLSAVGECISKRIGSRGSKNWSVFAKRARLDEDAEEQPTLEAVAKEFGLTRERVRQIEDAFFGKDYRGVAANAVFLGDFLRIADEVFGDGWLLDEASFSRSLAEKLPAGWGDCHRQACRLLTAATGDDRVEVDGFVTFRFKERGEARYTAFREIAKTLASRLDATEAAMCGKFEAAGLGGLSAEEWKYFGARAVIDEPGLFKPLFGQESRGQRIRRTIIEVLLPRGRDGMTLEELENALQDRLGDDAPVVRGYLWRQGSALDLDGKGLSVWTASAPERGKPARYALSSCWEPLGAEVVRQMEEELAAHLREHKCHAGILGRFRDEWVQGGRIPESVNTLVLRELLRRESTGTIIQYPSCRGAVAYALAGVEVAPNELLRAEALRYFGARVVPRAEMLDFATRIYGYSDAATAATACLMAFNSLGERVFRVSNRKED